MNATPSDPRIRAAAHTVVAGAARAMGQALEKSERVGGKVKIEFLARLKALETRHAKAAILLVLHAHEKGMTLEPPTKAEMQDALAPMYASVRRKLEHSPFNSAS